MRLLSLTFLLLVPNAGWAEVCDKIRPRWQPSDGPVSAVGEMLFLLGLPVSIGIFCFAAIALLTGSRVLLAAGFVLVALSGAAIWSQTNNDLYGFVAAGTKEGCIGSPHLFIGLCAAICMASLYSALRPRRRPPTGDA